MKNYPIFIFAGLFSVLSSTGLFSQTLSEQCKSYNTCDTLVACELTLAAQKHFAGITPDYNTAAVKAIQHDTRCQNYPDEFAKTTISKEIEKNNKTILLAIDWDIVRQKLGQSQEDSVIDPVKLNEKIDTLLPWYGVLVVKKGSLDTIANSESPIISTEYMKRNKNTFFPGNSNKPLGMWAGCTHGNHMAADNDIVNRAARLTFGDETDILSTFFKGNDYYVYDGEDVYIGTAMVIGEIALAVITLGASASVSASKAAAQTTLHTTRALSAQRAIVLTKRAEQIKRMETAAVASGNARKIQQAQRLGVETRRAARLALGEAGGAPVSQLTNTAALTNMRRMLEASGVAAETVAAAKPLTWISALSKPWKMITPGMQALKPRNIAKFYGSGVSMGQRIKRAAMTVGGVGIGTMLVKAFGYSSSSLDNYADGVSFNSFGLLSADDLDGRDNEVSHGAWIMFEETIEVNEGDAYNEAARFVEEFTSDMEKVNKSDPMCDVDIYVVQPGISNPEKTGAKEMYYIIQSEAHTVSIK